MSKITSKLGKLIDAKTLNGLIQSKPQNLKVLDCTYAPYRPPEFKDLDAFHKKYYGKFEELLKLPNPNRDTYLAGHIPSSNYFDFNVATNPGKYESFVWYEPEIFEKYARLLGINQDDHLVLYSKGPMGGMLWAGKAYWIWKTYGHENLSILNGGFADWQNSGFPIKTLKEMPVVDKGNFSAKFHQERTIKFEEFVHDDVDAPNLNHLAQKANILDARPRAQYNGEEPTGFDPSKVSGSFIPGTKNVPVKEFVDENGRLKGKEELDKQLKSVNFDPNKPTIILCGGGIQASFLAFILDDYHPQLKLRVYNGSNKEIEARDPKKINGNKNE